MENLNDGIWKIDEAGKTTYVNQQMADMLGYTIEENDRELFDGIYR